MEMALNPSFWLALQTHCCCSWASLLHGHWAQTIYGLVKTKINLRNNILYATFYSLFIHLLLRLVLLIVSTTITENIMLFWYQNCYIVYNIIGAYVLKCWLRLNVQLGYSLQFVRPSVGKKVAAACRWLRSTWLVRWYGWSLRGKISGMLACLRVATRYLGLYVPNHIYSTI